MIRSLCHSGGLAGLPPKRGHSASVVELPIKALVERAADLAALAT